MSEVPNLNQSIKVDLDATENIVCEECGSTYFSPVFVIKKVSALMSPTGDERLIPIQTFKCSDCGHVNEKFGLTKKD
tara:strand:- start:1791 stop:2021 length:231 start_codon:yes stop_codon:yes gene_type:complete